MLLFYENRTSELPLVNPDLNDDINRLIENADLDDEQEVLQSSFELSSMGIRVDREALLRQLDLAGTQERKNLLFHRRLLQNELSLSIGGGIGQSWLCMYYLRKAHIGEIQVSLWPEEMKAVCSAHGITLL